jgi:hypothetical protein
MALTAAQTSTDLLSVLGYLPNLDDRICIRDLPCIDERLPHILCQHVLGNGWDLDSRLDSRLLLTLLGLFLAAGVVRASITIESNWGECSWQALCRGCGSDCVIGWRIPFMIQWVWPVPLLILAFFAPESEFGHNVIISRLYFANALCV